MYNTYSSIVPSEMTKSERQHMCTELQTAKNWKQAHAVVKVGDNLVKVPTTDLKDYQSSTCPLTGALIR